MKKKIVTVLLSFISILTVSAQGVPDNDFILNTILDGASPYHYHSIFPRYIKGDTTLTEKDYYYLYYGYAFQDSYKPLEAIPAKDKMLVLLSKGGTMSQDDCRQVIEYAHEVMQLDPFSPSNINFMTYMYTKLGDQNNAIISSDRFNKIVEAIQSTGVGADEKSPWHVLWSSHGKDLLMAKGLMIQKTYVVSKDVEYVMLQKRDAAGNRGYYFDYSRMYLSKYSSNESGKRVEGLELNGIRIKTNK